MAENAGARFYEGLRVTADHLRHMQDQLWVAVGDLRRALGSGRIAWGLRVDIVGGMVRVSPGVAFSADGVRLAVETETDLALPPDPLPLLVRLVAINEDRVSLQLGGVATYVTLRADVTVLPQAGAVADPDSLDIAVIADGALDPATTATGPVALQDPGLFIAAGHHGHSGDFTQAADGTWSYDGPEIPAIGDLRADLLTLTNDLATLGTEVATVTSDLAALVARVTTVEGLTARITALEGDAVRQADLAALDARVAALEPLVGQVGALAAALQALQAQVDALPSQGTDPAVLAGLTQRIDDLETEIASLRGLLGLPGQVASLSSDLDGLTNRVRALEQASPGSAFDPDWPVIVNSNWPHAQTVPPDTAVRVLQQLVIDLSEPLADTVLSSAPEVIQVWLEPEPDQRAQFPWTQIVALQGKTQFGDGTIAWTLGGDPRVLTNALANGGRMMLRVHCGALADVGGRPFSSSLTAFTGFKAPPIPGGVLESWFFVEQG